MLKGVLLVKTFSGIYKGNRLIELDEDIGLTKNIKVLIMIPEEDDEILLRNQFLRTAEGAFAKIWNNEEDTVWNEYL